jgi:hypothetical protein
VFADSNFGLYNNHINAYQRVYSSGGDIREVETGRDATYRSNKDDLAFLGELRLGGSYDLSCNWRAVLAYRAVAVHATRRTRARRVSPALISLSP